MKKSKLFIFALATLLLCGCATSRHATKTSWQTAQATNCIATLTLDSLQYTIGCTMQAIKDSLIIIAIKPMPAIEIGRLEITPHNATAIDKINHQYTTVELTKNSPIVPKIRWNDLQTFASGEKAQKGDKVTLHYAYQQHQIRLDLQYGELSYDTPMNIRRLNTDKYKYIATFLSE